MTSYEVRVKGRKKVVGPLPIDLIVRGLELKRVPFDAEVREAGTKDWVPLSSIDEFYEAMGLDDEQTQVHQRPRFDTSSEIAGDEATRVLSSLWTDRPPGAAPGLARSRHASLPAPLPPSPRPGLPPPQAPRPPVAASVPPPQQLLDAGTDEASTALVDGFAVAGARAAPSSSARVLPPLPPPPVVPARPPSALASRQSAPPGAPPASLPPALPPPQARPPRMTPSAEAGALMDADEDDEDVRVVRDISGARPLPTAKATFPVRPAAGEPARPSQAPPAYRPDLPDELTAPARRLLVEQARTRQALAWTSAALGVALVVLVLVLLLR